MKANEPAATRTPVLLCARCWEIGPAIFSRRPILKFGGFLCLPTSKGLFFFFKVSWAKGTALCGFY